jgi:hypothetical protein
LKSYLFQPNTGATYSEIETNIRKQAKRYLPFINIDRIEFTVPEDNPDLFPNNLSVSVLFTIVPLQSSAILNVEVNNNIN